MKRLLWIFVLPLLASSIPFQVLDLNKNDPKQGITLLSVDEERDPAQGAIRTARIQLSMQGQTVTLSCGNYALPVRVGKVQIDCPVTGGYRNNSTIDHWGLRADARIRVWPADSPWAPDGEFVYPVRQRWFLTHTQMANEPTYVDGGEQLSRKKVYYHAGLDIGGTEALAPVIFATSGRIVSLAGDMLAEPKTGSPVAPRYDVLYLLDSRGWYYRYSHLSSFDPSLKLGAMVQKGDRLGFIGKEGGSGGWSHLHFEIVSRQPSGEWGTQEGFAFLWEAYLRDFRPGAIAVARPHRYARVNEEVILDASSSWVRKGTPRLEWQLSDGRKTGTAKVRMQYREPGTYSEILKVTSGDGSTAYDFATVNVHGSVDPPTINGSCYPSLEVRAGQQITCKVRTFGRTNGEETWNFGDGSAPRTTRSDGNAVKLAKDGYATIKHTYKKSGDYIITIRNGPATTHLWIPVQ